MLTLRLQRTGRKGYALYRVVAQDARRSPTSGSVAAYLGSYNPHSKAFTINREKVEFYLEHGAQPSPRLIHLFEKEGLKLPEWVRRATKKERSIKKPDKLRKNRPKEVPAAAPAAEGVPTEGLPEDEVEAAAVEVEAAPAPEAAAEADNAAEDKPKEAKQPTEEKPETEVSAEDSSKAA